MCTSDRAATWLALVILAGGVAACDHGVIPRELEALGSLESARYTARHLYADGDEPVVLMRPRLGAPALVLPAEDRLTVTYWTTDTTAATPLSLHAHDGADASHLLHVSAPPVCDGDGICRVEVRLPAPLPDDTVLELCLTAGAHRHCQPGALQRFSSLPDPLRLAVVTDLHLTVGSLSRDAARLRRLLNAVEGTEPAVHLVVALGDLTDHGAPEELQRFLAEVRGFSRPMVVLPGNHEYKDGSVVHYLRLVSPVLDPEIRLGPYLLLGLNTGPGLFDETGRGTNALSAGLEAAQVQRLRTTLAAPDTVSAVLTHHPPWSTGWYVIGRRRRAFLDACRAGGARLILSGHTHRNEVYDHAGLGTGLSTRCETDLPAGRLPVTVISAASTQPHHAGYRLVELHTDGRAGYCWQDVDVTD